MLLYDYGMKAPPRIFLVEDDPEIGALTQSQLSQEGFDVRLAVDAAGLDRLMAKEQPHMVILDLMLPGEDGLSICRRLRLTSDVHILMLTARTDEIDRVVGLELGADDYLGKPFSMRELVARIRAVMRRGAPDRAPANVTLHFEAFHAHLDRLELRRGDKEITLTSGEFALLRVFLQNPGRVLSRDQLMDMSQGRVADSFDRTVDVQISRLRAKLGENPRDPRMIKTVRNAGYIFTSEVRR
ncbi:winged helix-turn-helix domain-containing protein [Yoonia sp. SS1-5]|uniref:Regulatory protein VirG n=1 Tax=Yoonia rhodophyticola TaxID=3137370 RepID=A0AAN0M7B3_9RHOB